MLGVMCFYLYHVLIFVVILRELGGLYVSQN